MARSVRAGTGASAWLAIVLLLLRADGAGAQARDGAARAWVGLGTGLSWLRQVDEAASPLRYGGTELPLALEGGRTGDASGWNLSLELRRAPLSPTSGAAGSAADRRISLRGGWTRRMLGAPGSPLALHLGLGAQAGSRLRSQSYPQDTRRFSHTLVELRPHARLEHARARDAFTAEVETPVLALVRQAYGPGVPRPWRLEAPGEGLHGGRFSLDWWHRLGGTWRLQLGYRADLLRLGEAPALAETVRGGTVGLAYHPGRLLP